MPITDPSKLAARSDVLPRAESSFFVQKKASVDQDTSRWRLIHSSSCWSSLRFCGCTLDQPSLNPGLRTAFGTRRNYAIQSIVGETSPRSIPASSLCCVASPPTAPRFLYRFRRSSFIGWVKSFFASFLTATKCWVSSSLCL